MPKVASAETQAEFIALYECLTTELGADEAAYFADAVHPEYQTKPAFGWVKTASNPAVKTTAGRGRVNIHGALNLETFDAPFVEPTTADEASAMQLLAEIAARNPDKRVIHVIWDNAPITRGLTLAEFLSLYGRTAAIRPHDRGVRLRSYPWFPPVPGFSLPGIVLSPKPTEKPT